MATNKTKKIILLVFVLILLFVAGISLLTQIKTSSKRHILNELTTTTSKINNSAFNEYTSNSLKISLKYPKSWHIDDQYPFLLLTSYPASLNKESYPKEDQLKILIGNFVTCFDNFEKDLIYPACGENLPAPYTITYKSQKDTGNAAFYKYITRGSSGDVHIYYLLVGGKRILKIDKTPDPSQYEKEFDEIINSIKFL